MTGVDVRLLYYLYIGFDFFFFVIKNRITDKGAVSLACADGGFFRLLSLETQVSSSQSTNVAVTCHCWSKVDITAALITALIRFPDICHLTT